MLDMKRLAQSHSLEECNCKGGNLSHRPSHKDGNLFHRPSHRDGNLSHRSSHADIAYIQVNDGDGEPEEVAAVPAYFWSAGGVGDDKKSSLLQ